MIPNLDELIISIKKELLPCGDFENIMSIIDSYSGNDWTDYIEFSDKKFNIKSIYKNYKFELILISWLEGQEIPLHDHPNNGCIMKVLSGCIQENIYDNTGEVSSTCFHDENKIIYSNKHTYHSLKSESKSITLHIYSPPDFY